MNDINDLTSVEQLFSKFNDNPLNLCSYLKYIPINGDLKNKTKYIYVVGGELKKKKKDKNQYVLIFGYRSKI
ncbi:hypothetical protein BpHYR1_017377 [Brachionus plicatilis]|uniref:Uncharacterized protein n=1 Tax=Brachionus plicatilis TaxID=10195 RepID=A0A3M7Q0G5_BRAPC|nr:hypothetical protein BpHYR1_017377 [Brachionus plicatilis]